MRRFSSLLMTAFLVSSSEMHKVFHSILDTRGNQGSSIYSSSRHSFIEGPNASSNPCKALLEDMEGATSREPHGTPAHTWHPGRCLLHSTQLLPFPRPRLLTGKDSSCQTGLPCQRAGLLPTVPAMVTISFSCFIFPVFLTSS